MVETSFSNTKKTLNFKHKYGLISKHENHLNVYMIHIIQLIIILMYIIYFFHHLYQSTPTPFFSPPKKKIE